MNREILFRGKRLDNGEWVYGYYLFSGSDFILPEGMFLNNIASVDPSTVGQYTGITDNNGVKIFEGDVVTVIYVGTPGEKKITGPVVYGEHETQFYVNTAFFGYGIYGMSPEVIGNIHDHPELLEGHTK